MIKKYVLFLSLLTVFTTGCKRDQKTNKIVDGPPVNSNAVVIPAQAIQQLLLLKRDLTQTVVPIVNRLTQTNQTYPELSGPNGSFEYTFQRTEPHYGTASVTIQFRDNTNAVIDPIQTQSSTTTLASVVITLSGTSSLFSYSENLVLSLETAGNIDSKKSLTGTSNFTGSNCSITFTLGSPGCTSSFDGLTEGNIAGSGSSGPASDPFTMNLQIAPNHSADGTMTWETQNGSFHIEDNGSGYVVTETSLIFIQ